MSIQRINSNTLADGAALNSVPGGVNFRNRIINGDMRIDQRNAGASVTVNSIGVQYPVDRNGFSGTGSAGVFTAQRDTDSPPNFINSVKVTVTTAAASYSATANYVYEHRVEGLNGSDFVWGTASAQAVTFSFWVRSSLTGTFSGALANGARNRSYPFNYTISSANTWEHKTVTIEGDTTGTWLTDNGVGIRVLLNLGAGTDRLGTAGAWNNNRNVGATGSVQLMSTLNATWYITGVQLEAGSVATPFERRPFGTELALCQRYYQVSAIDGMFISVSNNTGASCPFNAPLTVPLRATPSSTLTTVDMEDFRGGTSSNRNISSFTYTENSSGVRVNVARLLTSASQVIRYITSLSIPFSAEL